jgi:hypothetical protein
VYQRKEISLREEFAEYFQTFFTTAHTSEPIMHQRHTHKDKALSEA